MIAYKETTPQERGLLRAVTQGVKAEHIGAGLYRTSSVSRPGVTHMTTVESCDCEAASVGRYCKHRAAVAVASQHQPNLPYALGDGPNAEHRCQHCGWIGANVVPSVEHVGGQGEVTMWFCEDRRGCWNRWETQHSIV